VEFLLVVGGELDAAVESLDFGEGEVSDEFVDVFAAAFGGQDLVVVPDDYNVVSLPACGCEVLYVIDIRG
jgi:hypothetical protein